MSGSQNKTRFNKNESGSVLVEFALVSLVLYLILAATLDFGRLFLVSNVAQNAARSAAVLLSGTPAAQDATVTSFGELLDDPTVKSTIYDPGLLVIDPGTDPEDLPVVNQILFRTAMISDVINGANVVRYPGAVFSDPAATSGYRVLIPQITGRDEAGIETITWVDVLEEIQQTGQPPPFTQDPRIIAVRINYPYQAAMLSGFRPNPAGPYEPNIVDSNGNWGVNEANDAEVSAPFPVPDVESDVPIGPYSGPYGLGRQLAFAKTVRPYRKLLSGEAIEAVREMIQ
jgi:hypothetical protein